MKTKNVDQVDSKEDQALKVILPKSKHLVHMNIQVPETTTHDFRQTQLCYVPCNLTVTNPNPFSCVFILDVKPDSNKFTLLGLVKGRVRLEAGQKRQIKFSAGVTFPGLYQCKRSLTFQMIKEGDSVSEKELSDFVPIEIAFVVQSP